MLFEKLATMGVIKIAMIQDSRLFLARANEVDIWLIFKGFANWCNRLLSMIVGIIAKVVPESMTPSKGLSLSGSIIARLPYESPRALTPQKKVGFSLPLAIFIDTIPFSPPTIWDALYPPKMV